MRIDRSQEESTVSFPRSADCHRGQVLLAALIAAACCAAFAGSCKTPPPAAPPRPASWTGAASQAVAGAAPSRREWTATTAGSLDADVRPEVAGRVARRLAAGDRLVRRGGGFCGVEPRAFQRRV